MTGMMFPQQVWNSSAVSTGGTSAPLPAICNTGQQIFQQTLIYLAPYWQNCRCLSKEKQMPLSQELCFAVVSIHFALALCGEPQWHCSCFTSLHKKHSKPDPSINHISKETDGATPLSMRGQAATSTFYLLPSDSSGVIEETKEMKLGQCFI